MKTEIYTEKIDRFKRIFGLVGYSLLFVYLWVALRVSLLGENGWFVAGTVLLAVIFVGSVAGLLRFFRQKSMSVEEAFQRKRRERLLVFVSLYAAVAVVCISNYPLSLIFLPIFIAYSHVEAGNYLGHVRLLVFEAPAVVACLWVLFMFLSRF